MADIHGSHFYSAVLHNYITWYISNRRLHVDTLPLSCPCTAFLWGIWRVEEPAKVQRIPGRLVDVFEAIGTQVNPAKVAGDHNQHIIHFLETRVTCQRRCHTTCRQVKWRAKCLQGSEGGVQVYLLLQFPRRHRYLSGSRSAPQFSSRPTNIQAEIAHLDAAHCLLDIARH